MPLAPKKFIILEKVGSTNNYAMGMLQNGVANSGDGIFALEQTAGKGRRGKLWESGKGQNIILTIIAAMQWLPVISQFQLSVAVALACHNLVSQYIKDDIKIKWPNDIYINDRKAGGILIENLVKGKLWQWSVIGIGLNINQENFEKEGLHAISFKQIAGRSFDVQELGKELHKKVIEKINALQDGEFSEMLKDYNKNLFALNKIVKLKKGNIVFETTIQNVSASGELITNDVMERSFGFDETEWVF
jgi:BirA family biotin operon repressor/biotin-[acetyl-CoA-carboxylase] ligase